MPHLNYRQSCDCCAFRRGGAFPRSFVVSWVCIKVAQHGCGSQIDDMYYAGSDMIATVNCHSSGIYDILLGVRCCRVNPPNRCYHLTSRIAHRAYFLDEGERTRRGLRRWGTSRASSRRGTTSSRSGSCSSSSGSRSRRPTCARRLALRAASILRRHISVRSWRRD